MEKNIIVAISDNYAIGKDNKIPWHIKEDLKYFKEITSGYPVIMGSNTYKSIGKPLPNRTNIVVTHKYYDGVICVPTITQAYAAAERHSDENECFIIGGAQLYKAYINDAVRLFVTHIHTVIEDADTFFPQIDELEWIMVSSSDMKIDEESGLEYNFEVYIRKNYGIH